MKLEHSILFFGDLHSGFDHCLSIVKTYRPKAIILLGDIQATMPLDQHLKEVSALTEVWWIHGNHDTGTEDYYDYLFQSKLADKCLDGKVQEIAGYKVAGLGGIFRGKIWYPKASSWNYFSEQDYLQALGLQGQWRDGICLRHRSSIFPEKLMALKQQQADILVTHEAPSCNRFGFSCLDRLAQSLGVKLMFHGHHHDNYDYQPHFKRMGFKTYSVGLRGVTDLTGKVLRKGEEDGETENRVARLY